MVAVIALATATAGGMVAWRLRARAQAPPPRAHAAAPSVRVPDVEPPRAAPPPADTPRTLPPRRLAFPLGLGALTERTELTLSLWSTEGERLSLFWAPASDPSVPSRARGPRWDPDAAVPAITDARVEGEDLLEVTVRRLPVSTWRAIAWLSHDGRTVGRSRAFDVAPEADGGARRVRLLWFSELGTVSPSIVVREEVRDATFSVVEDGEDVGDTRRWVDGERVIVAPGGSTVVVRPTRLDAASTIDLPPPKSLVVEAGARTPLVFGAPAARVRLRASLPDGRPSPFEWRLWKLEPDGTERPVRPPLRSEGIDGWRGELGTGRYGVVASTKDAAPTFARFDVETPHEDDEQEVLLRLRADGARSTLRLRSPEGRPLRRFTVLLARSDATGAEESAFASTTTDDQGTAVTPPLLRGTYVALVEGRGVARIVEVGDGATDLTWVVPRLSPDVRAGTVAGAVRGVPDEFAREALVLFESVSPRSEWLYASSLPVHLPEGRWRVSLFNPAAVADPLLRPWSEIAVREGARTQLEIDLSRSTR
jgi:hypothetical protein